MLQYAGDCSVIPAVDTGVEIVLHGPLCVIGADGSDLTPRPNKVRGLVALLATAPGYRRSRRWIEERLWSDRAPQQAAGSLRQALVDLRRALGPAEAMLNTDREWVEFRAEAFRLRPPSPAEFLEGIDIRDPSFRRWLDAMRRQSAGSAAVAVAAPVTGQLDAAPRRPVLVRFGTPVPAATNSGIAADIVASRIANDISDQLSVTLVARTPASEGIDCDLDISCNVIEDNGICLALIKVVHLPTHKVIYSRDFRITGTAAGLIGHDELIRAAVEAAERTVARVPLVVSLNRPAAKSAALGQLALHRMFSFDEAGLAEADRLMEAAWEVEENPVHLAWRALLQMVTSIERPLAARADLMDLADRLSRQALEHDAGTAAGNATVRALVGQTRAMLWGDAQAAGHAAQAALSENPRNPYALQAMAVAHMLDGEGERAYELSQLGRSYASRSAFRVWWDAHHATVCVATGRLSEAITAAEAARFAAPSLRPAYRYLLSLYAQRGDLDRAEQMRAKLEVVEPGFSLSRMIEDPDYPVRTLRQTGLLREARKLL